jgi:hypothetical protein
MLRRICSKCSPMNSLPAQISGGGKSVVIHLHSSHTALPHW